MVWYLRWLLLKLRKMRIRLRTDLNIAQLAGWLNPIINGWVGYYGQFCRSELYRVFRQFNKALVRWERRKFKALCKYKTWVSEFMLEIATINPRFFAHWRPGMVGAFSWWERHEFRGSRTVLREAASEIPAVYSPQVALGAGRGVQRRWYHHQRSRGSQKHGVVKQGLSQH